MVQDVTTEKLLENGFHKDSYGCFKRVSDWMEVTYMNRKTDRVIMYSKINKVKRSVGNPCEIHLPKFYDVETILEVVDKIHKGISKEKAILDAVVKMEGNILSV